MGSLCPEGKFYISFKNDFKFLYFLQIVRYFVNNIVGTVREETVVEIRYCLYSLLQRNEEIHERQQE